jgi:hypothetical protein
MPTINQHWYSSNNTRGYPLDDAASGVDDKGKLLPSDILVDAALRFPSHYGVRAALSTVTVTPNIVAITIVGVLEDTFSPLAICTIKQPVQQGKAYAVKSQVPGVGGWVVFGSGVKGASYNGRFTTAEQGVLSARAARPYRPLPVESVRNINDQQALTGLVALRASAPLEITAEVLEINDVLRQAVVFRLVDTPEQTSLTVAATTAQTSVFSQFSGACGGRPESYTCPEPTPIEFINSVYPDCYGKITLDFRGCARLTPIEDFHGAIIECQASLTDVCPAPFLPDSAGLLPSEYTAADVPVPVTTTTTTTPAPAESVSASDLLPYCECFDGSTSVDWVVHAGTFGFVADDSPNESEYCPAGAPVSYESRSASGNNLAVWNGDDILNIGRITVTELKLTAGPPGAKHNGGLLLNYRPHLSIAGQVVWFAAVLDYDTQEIKFLRFNGSTPVTVVVVSAPGIVLDEWYKISVTVEPAVGTTNITIQVEGITTPSFSAVIGPFGVSSYAPSSGKNGVYADRAQTYWSYWCYDAAPE